MPQPPADSKNFASLVKVISDLRGPEGCPWDKKQTHSTLARYAIEETAELVDAIETKNSEAICEELGDVLLQVVLHSEIARQDGNFDIGSVIESITKKMVTRHPHVFAGEKSNSARDVSDEWQAQKKKKSPQDAPLSHGIPKELPALLTSQKIGERTKAYNFDWTNTLDVIAKVEEELDELKEAINNGSKAHQLSELGDLLFSVAQLARHLDGDAEQALRKTNRKFEKRFMKMMALIAKQNRKSETLTTDELEIYWQKAKIEEEKL